MGARTGAHGVGGREKEMGQRWGRRREKREEEGTEHCGNCRCALERSWVFNYVKRERLSILESPASLLPSQGCDTFTF